MREGVRALREAGDTETFKGIEPDGPMPPMVSPDADIAAVIDGRSSDYVKQKMAAMRAHRSQITLDGPFFSMDSTFGEGAWGQEHFRLAAGVPFPGTQVADDLFAGLD
jgi:N-acetyl-1-D-myo-inositol-2-amino-2-deoxy-alpha-D-glucopyranoside deacetylase